MSGILPLQDSMLLFEDERLTDEKKKSRESARVFVLKTELDKALFDSNILIYAGKHPDTKDDCVLCLFANQSERELIESTLKGLGEKVDDGCYSVYDIDVYIFTASNSIVNDFLEG